MAYHRRTILSEPPDMSRFREGTTKRVFTKSECASVVEIRDLSCIGVKKCKNSVRGKTYLGIPEPNGLESYVRLRRHSEQDRQTLSQEPEMRIPLSPFGVPSTNAIEVTGPPCPEYSCRVFPVLGDHEHRVHEGTIGVHSTYLQIQLANLVRVLSYPGVVPYDLDIKGDTLELERVAEIFSFFRLPPASLD